MDFLIIFVSVKFFIAVKRPLSIVWVLLVHVSEGFLWSSKTFYFPGQV